MNTNFIKIAICAVLFGMLEHSVEADDGGTAGIQLDTVTTLSGKVFRDVEIITADQSGLLFRHSRGTAKVDFTDLNQNLREMFESAPVAPAIDDADDENGADPIDLAEGEDDDGSYEELEIETRTRIVITLPLNYGHGSYCCNPFDPRTVNWRPHWGRYHYGLSYANFHCRQAAERDLLIQSGFLR